MTVTQAQLQGVCKFTFGAATHRVEKYTCAATLERTGVGHNAFRRFIYTIEAEIEGSSLSNLKTLLDSAKSGLINSGSDFAIFRAGTKVHEHLAADCHFGPVATLSVNGNQQSGTFETITITVECLVPVSTAGGLIDHVFNVRTVVDDEGNVASIVQTGTVTTTAAQSATDWINANVPAQPAGYDRTLDIQADDTDSSATYTLTDAKTDRRHYDANVRDHKFSRTRTWQDGLLQTIAYSGTVRMVEGQSAAAFIEANLPATTPGYARSYSISNSDDDRDGTYSVTDTRATWSAIPGIDKAQLEASRSVDTQGRVTLERRGYFIGNNAQTQVDAVRSALAALGAIIFEEVRQDIYNDQRWSFRFTALTTNHGDPPSGIIHWREVVRRSGGGRPRLVSVYPDRYPFIYLGAPGPVVITVSGQAVTVTGAYADPPDAPSSIETYQSGDPDVSRNRLSEIERETTWSMTFICPPGTVAPEPRGRPEPGP